MNNNYKKLNMIDTLAKRWNERYKKPEFAYGKEPNEFLKKQLRNIKAGNILFGAEGEGRNAVYAAKSGWNVSAFDISEEGKNKALKLANENNVSIDYQVGQLPDLKLKNNAFDVVALIYAHFPANLRKEYHTILDKKLKSGGIILFEAFGKNHLKYREENPKIGGPTNLEALFSIEELKLDFENYDIHLLEEKEVELSEGLYHNGKGSVIRFIGQKK